MVRVYAERLTACVAYKPVPRDRPFEKLIGIQDNRPDHTATNLQRTPQPAFLIVARALPNPAASRPGGLGGKPPKPSLHGLVARHFVVKAQWVALQVEVIDRLHRAASHQ